jgi:hypothetical protein
MDLTEKDCAFQSFGKQIFFIIIEPGELMSIIIPVFETHPPGPLLLSTIEGGIPEDSCWLTLFISH